MTFTTALAAASCYKSLGEQGRVCQTLLPPPPPTFTILTPTLVLSAYWAHF